VSATTRLACFKRCSTESGKVSGIAILLISTRGRATERCLQQRQRLDSRADQQLTEYAGRGDAAIVGAMGAPHRRA
jgi:hypothetical protein